MMITDKEGGGGVGVGGVGGSGSGSGGGGGEKEKSIARLNSCKKLISDGVPDEFPVGLRVLVVDDDRKCLMILEKLLQKCQYQVTTCSQSTEALSMLRGKRDGFDIVISDVHMPDMDGFKLLEHIGLEMDLPVIMMSADDKPDTVMKGVLHGACDYLVKPIRLENLKTIWQHVIRKKNNELKEMENSDGMEDNERTRRSPDDADNASSGNEGSVKNSKRRKEEDNEVEKDDSSTLKKQRVVWQSDLHKKFIVAVHQLGVDKAVPKKILEIMNVPGLTRENVASHLQKFRIYLKRVSGIPQHQNGPNASFMAYPDASFGTMAPLDEVDFQVFSANTGSLPFTDQRNMFTAETSSLRFGAGQQQRINTNNKQVNLHHGIATTMDSKLLSNLNQTVPSVSNMGFQVNDGVSGYLNFGAGTSSFGSAGTFHQNQSNPLMMQMPQSTTRSHLLNELAGSHASRLPLATGHQQIFSSEIPGQVLGRNRTVVNLGSSHCPVAQPSLVVDSLTSHIRRQTGNDLAFGSASGAASFTSTGIFQHGENLEPTGLTSFSPSYDTLNDIHQNKFVSRELQNDSLAFDANTIQGSFNLPPSVGSQQSYMCNQMNELNSNTSIICKSEISLREGNAQGNPDSILRRQNSLVVENRSGIQAGRIVNQNFANTLPASHLTHQNDFGSVFGQQDFSGLGRPEISSDWYKIDNIQGRVGPNLPGI